MHCYSSPVLQVLVSSLAPDFRWMICYCICTIIFSTMSFWGAWKFLWNCCFPSSCAAHDWQGCRRRRTHGIWSILQWCTDDSYQPYWNSPILCLSCLYLYYDRSTWLLSVRQSKRQTVNKRQCLLNSFSTVQKNSYDVIVIRYYIGS